MAQTISSLIQGINDSKAVLVDKAVAFGLIAEENKSSAKLADAASAINNISIHDCEDYTVAMGTQITISEGYHKGCTITGGAPEDVEATYKLKDITVDSPKPGSSANLVVSLASHGGDDASDYYGIDTVTVKPLGNNYADVSDASNSMLLSTKVLAGEAVYAKSVDPANNTIEAVKVEGTMPNNGAVSATLDTSTKSYTIPKGYHDGTGVINIATHEIAVTPSKERQEVTPNAGKVLSKVTVAKIPDNYADVSDASIGTSAILAPQVLTGVTVYANSSPEGGDAVAVKVVGNMANNGAVSATLDTSTTSYTIPIGFHNGKGKVSITTEEKTATPTKEEQSITPSSGKVLSKVTVAKIPDAYQNVTGVTASAADVLMGKKIVTSTGLVVEGTMPLKGAVSASIDGINTTSYTVPAGYHIGSGKVTFDDSAIIAALAAI